MNLLDYMKPFNKAELDAFAEACDTSTGQLKQIAYGHRRAGAALAISIDRHSGGKVPCEVLRPDIDWGYLRGSAGGLEAA